jgi:hypothetical protein
MMLRHTPIGYARLATAAVADRTLQELIRPACNSLGDSGGGRATRAIASIVTVWTQESPTVSEAACQSSPHCSNLVTSRHLPKAGFFLEGGATFSQRREKVETRVGETLVQGDTDGPLKECGPDGMEGAHRSRTQLPHREPPYARQIVFWRLETWWYSFGRRAGICGREASRYILARRAQEVADDVRQ